MKTISIRGLASPVIEALKKAAQERSVSMNRFVVDALADAVQMGRARACVYHDLDEFFGTWSEEECARIQKVVKKQRKIDKELWQ